MVTLLVLAICLFILGLLFGKRFGVLTLTLAAGFIIVGYLGNTISAVVAPYLKQYVAYVPTGVIIAPALVPLLFAKGRHRSVIVRIVNAVLFAAAGVIFVILAPGTPVSLTGNFVSVKDNAGLIVTGLLGLAVLEVTFGKPSKKKPEEPKK